MRILNQTVLVALLALPGLIAGCGGTTEDTGGQGQAGAGNGGSGGSGGSSGKAGSGASAGSGTAGSGAGSGQAGQGQAGSGASAGSGTAGSGASAGSGTAGSGASAGSGTAGSGGMACKPGESQPSPDGCNTCVCAPDGSWACTDKACPPECTGGPPPCAAPPEGCSYQGAGCINGQWTCGNLTCGGQCKPGESQPAPDGCNTCVCAPDGAWVCTDKACVSECTGPMPPCAPPPDGCGYVGGGCINGQWTCGNLVCATPCKADSDCPAIKMACQMCPNGDASCPSSQCVVGSCEIVWSACGGGVAPGLPCGNPGTQAPADDGCNTCTCGDTGTWSCTRIGCVPECTGPMPPCAPPPDGCDYVNGGCVNGQWTCGNLVCGAQCKQDSDCPGIKAPCQVCADGSTACPVSQCLGGQCVASFPSCPVECAGGPPPCAAPPDGCDYVNGGCVNGQWTCGNLVCGNQCKQASDCPGIKAPCLVCADGSTACPSVDCVAGQCVSSFPSCPVECAGPPPPCAAPPDGCNYVNGGCVNGQWTCGDLVCGNQCKADSDCPAIKAPCEICPDGTQSCPSSHCVGNQCQVTWSGCGNACAAQKIAGVGSCKKLLGFAWDGKMCAAITGCECSGDCAGLFDSQAACDKAHASCQ